jgi:hypothetical protein
MTEAGEKKIGSGSVCKASYEAPELVAVGNLHDLLAGGGSLGCDNGCVGDPNGGNEPVGAPGCSPANC